MTRNAAKCVREFLKSDGMSIAGKNLKEAADLFSSMQQGCCPKSEVLQMFRAALRDGHLHAEVEGGAVVRYRALMDIERDIADKHHSNKSLQQERAQKRKTLKPSSPRLNPTFILPEPDPALEQDDEADKYGIPSWEPELVSMS